MIIEYGVGEIGQEIKRRVAKWRYICIRRRIMAVNL